MALAPLSSRTRDLLVANLPRQVRNRARRACVSRTIATVTRLFRHRFRPTTLGHAFHFVSLASGRCLADDSGAAEESL